MDQLKVRGKNARPLPPSSPNVLLIVLDTVGADHLGLYGYERPTSPTIDGLASRRDSLRSSVCGLVVDAAVAREHVHRTMAARALRRLVHPARRDLSHPGRVPGVAGIRHGRLHRQLLVLFGRLGTGARLHHLSGLYFPRLTACSTATLVDRLMAGLDDLEHFLEERLDFDLLKPVVERLWWLFKSNRKEAAEVNREFLDWLSGRRQPERPFFAFLNYYDAHCPYQLPERASTGSGRSRAILASRP